MRRMNITVFDEFLTGVVAGTTPAVTTSQELNARLGQFDQLGLFAVVDNTASTAGLFAFIEHSGDGRNWIQKNAIWEIEGTNNTKNGWFTANVTTPLWGFDPGTNPTLGFARIRVYFSASLSAHVRIHVTGRDMGG